MYIYFLEKRLYRLYINENKRPSFKRLNLKKE